MKLNGIYKSKCSLCPHKRRPRRAGGSESLASLPAMSALFWRQLERLVRSRAPSEDIKPNSQTTKSSSPSFMESINFVTSSATCFQTFQRVTLLGFGLGRVFLVLERVPACLINGIASTELVASGTNRSSVAFETRANRPVVISSILVVNMQRAGASAAIHPFHGQAAREV